MLIPPLAISHEWYAPTLLERLKHGEYPSAELCVSRTSSALRSTHFTRSIRPSRSSP